MANAPRRRIVVDCYGDEGRIVRIMRRGSDSRLAVDRIQLSQVPLHFTLEGVVVR